MCWTTASMWRRPRRPGVGTADPMPAAPRADDEPDSAWAEWRAGVSRTADDDSTDDSGAAGPTRSISSYAGHAWSLRPGAWTPTTLPSPSSAIVWEGCPWPSSWRPAGLDCCPRSACWTRSREVRRCSPPSWPIFPTGIRTSRWCWTAPGERWTAASSGCLARLAIFAGSFTQEAAEVVSGGLPDSAAGAGGGIGHPTVPEGPTGARFRVHELIRGLRAAPRGGGRPRLVETAQAARFDYLLGLVERAATRRRRPRSRGGWDAFDADLGNIRCRDDLGPRPRGQRPGAAGIRAACLPSGSTASPPIPSSWWIARWPFPRRLRRVASHPGASPRPRWLRRPGGLQPRT